MNNLYAKKFKKPDEMGKFLETSKIQKLTQII